MKSTKLLLEVPEKLIFRKLKGTYSLIFRKNSTLVYASSVDSVKTLKVKGAKDEFKVPCDLFAIAKLFRNFRVSENMRIYSFGMRSAEDNDPICNLQVTWDNNSPTEISHAKTEKVHFELGENEIYQGSPSNNSVVNPLESFLLVEASQTNPASLDIGPDATQGGAIAVILDSEGDFKGSLDPLLHGQTFTIDFNAFVIPFITPKQRIIFETGDPEEDAEAEYGDE